MSQSRLEIIRIKIGAVPERNQQELNKARDRLNKFEPPLSKKQERSLRRKIRIESGNGSNGLGNDSLLLLMDRDKELVLEPNGAVSLVVPKKAKPEKPIEIFSVKPEIPKEKPSFVKTLLAKLRLR